MASRKEVFQSKVLKKLYPPESTLEKIMPQVDVLIKESNVITRTIQGHSSHGNCSTGAKRLYTIIPPPADYKLNLSDSVTNSLPENHQNTEESDEKCENGGSNELATEPEEKKKRKRRKKQKLIVSALNQTAVDERDQRLSKNKRRKLKKKRHKEKLLSMGLLAPAAAVEFTYKGDRLRLADDDKEEKESSCQREEPAHEQEGDK